MRKLNKLCLVLAFTLCSTYFLRAQQKEHEQPNIIFILVDDQGFGDIGAFYQNERAKEGKPHERSPHLDKMADQGAMLMQHYSSSPVCAPSRASLLSGESQGHANVRDNQFDKALADNYSMASTLKELGYNTAVIGKWGLQGDDQWGENGSEWPARPTQRGFDYFLGYMRHIDGHEHYPKEAPYMGTREVWLNGEVITDKLDKSYTADLWTAAAKHWIEKHQSGTNKEDPFFLYLAYDTPHAILELPTQEYPEGGGLHGGLQWIGKKGNFINTASGEIDSYIYPEYANATYYKEDSTEAPWPETYKRFATANRRIDDGVGDIIQLLKDLDIDDNTLIVYTSDNGVSKETYLGDWQSEEEQKLPTFFSSYGPFDGIKRDTWEGGLRMPTIARWPGHIAPNTKVETPNIQYDWATTFTEIAGMTPPIKMDGVSLLPALTGEGTPLKTDLYVEYYFNGKTPSYEDFSQNHRGRIQKHMQNIRIGDYMGVRYNIQSATDDFEIYNVRKDPQQKNNLAKTDQLFRVDKKIGFNKTISKSLTADELNSYMKARVLQKRLPADDIERPYDNALIPAIDTENIRLKKGINWQFYEGKFPWIPQVATLQANVSGKTRAPKGSLGPKNKQGILFYSGYIKVPEDGAYTFYLKADHSAFLRIHDIQAIDADYHYNNQEKERTLQLKAGLHPFRLYYKQHPGNHQQIQLKWSGPGIEKQSLKRKDYYRIK